jgi:phospholipid-translocating ATPase
MSILLTDPDDGKIKLFIKGADSTIKERLDPKQINDETMKSIDDFLARSSVRGLRTLLFAMKVLDDEEYNDIMNQFAEAEDDIDKRDEMLQEIYDEFENDLVLLGATAVEDRLQDEVPQTLEDFRNGGISVWMLTGDKFETAENIGYS